MKKILLLINPYSRSGQSAENALLLALKEAQHTIVNTVPLLENTSFNDLIRRHRSEADLVLIGGGDGSMNEALQALVETQLPLLVFPQGTANNLARTFTIPRGIPEIVKMVNEAKQIKVDLGSVNGIYFINVAGLGLSAKINRSVSSSTKRFFGVFAFFASAFTAFFRMNTFHAKITTIEHGKETSVQVKSWQISVCNGKHYGNGLVIDENASLEDHKLHLLSTEVRTGWAGLKLIPSLISGKYKKDQEITLLTHSQIRISTRKKMKIDVDGDIKTHTPAEFKVHPKVLALLVPPTYPARGE